MKKDLNYIVRSSFENEGVEKAPNNFWDNISNELEQSEVDSIVKDSFEGQQDTAPEMVWERVQDQLDIDRVWIRIANKINIRRYGHLMRYVAVLLLLILPFNLDFDVSDLTNAPSVIEATLNNSIEVSDNLGVGNDIEDTNQEIPNLLGYQLNSASPAPSNSESNPVVDPVEVPVKNMTLDVNLATLPLASLNQTTLPEIQPLFTPKPKRSLGLMLGGVASLDNTWILDNETRSGFDNESLVENEFTLGSSYGVFAEYQLKPRFSISAEYLFQSRSNQRLHFYDHGVYSLKEREINSYKLALMLGWYTQPKLHGVSHSTVVKLGGYYSGVKSDYTMIDGAITDVNSIYKRNDSGLRLEVGKRLYVRSFVIDGGVRADYGLVNLTSTKSYIPSHLNFTRLVSGGAYLRIGYAF